MYALHLEYMWSGALLVDSVVIHILLSLFSRRHLLES